MSDQIKQEFGFDVSQAMSSLSTLDKAMGAFENRLGSSIQSMKAFNKQAGKEVAALKVLAENTRLAANEWERLNKAMGKSYTTQANASRGASRSVAPKSEKLLTGAAAAAEMDAFFAKAEAGLKKNQSIWQRWSGAVTSYLGQTASSTRKNSSTTGRSLTDLQKSLNKITVSWETMVRVVTTQAIVRALSTLRNAIRASIADALAFEKAVSEIRTISTVRQLDTLKTAVRNLSDEFNSPLSEVGESVYQTISNQIADGAKALQFFGDAAKFSKVAVASADDSVNLLTGTLNAFEKSSDEAGSVAAKFFKTIQLGRTRASELAGSFGEVAPIAHQLGISLDELQAAYATVTISGINTAKASTQLKGVLSGLIKPTTDMQKTLRQLGFESGEGIIAAYGLGGAMKLLASTTDGTSAGLAKLFPRVRGLTAAMILSGSGATKMADNLNQIEQASATLLNQEYQLIFETNAETVTRDFNKLKNFFTVEFGDAIVKMTADMSRFLGGVDSVTNGFKTMITVGPPLVASFLLIGGGMFLLAQRAKLLAANATLAGRSLASLGSIALAAVAAWAVGDYIGKQIATVMQSYGKAEREMSRKLVQANDASNKAFAQAEQQKLDKLLKLQRQHFAKRNSLYLKDVDNYRNSYKRTVEATESALKRVIKAYEDVANKQFQLATNASKAIQDSNRSILDSQQSLEDRIFQLQNGRNDQETQFTKLMERAAKIRRDAAADLAEAAKADDPEKARELALAEFERAQAFQEQAVAIAEREEYQHLERRAIEEMKRLQGDREHAEQRYREGVEQSAKAAQKQGIYLASNVKELERMEDQITKLLSHDTETGVKTPQELVRDRAQAAQLIKQFMAKAVGQDLPVSQMLDFSNVKEQLRRELNGVDIQLIQAAPAAMASFQTQLQSALDKMNLNVTVVGRMQLQAATGGQRIDTPEAAERAWSQAAKNLEEVNRKQNILKNLLKTQEEAVANVAKAAERIKIPTAPPQRGMFTEEGRYQHLKRDYEAGQQVLSIMKAITAEAADTQTTREEIDAIIQKVKQLRESGDTWSAWLRGGNVDQSTFVAINDALTALETKVSSRATSEIGQLTGDTEAAMEALASRKESILEYMRKVEGAFGSSMQTGQQALNGGVSPSAHIADNMERARDAVLDWANSMPTGGPKIPVATEYKGGFQHFASGGAARGIDTIPSMLAPHEFVINSRSSRRFFTQLQAINAGQRPVYRDSGGSVTNIGDVSINVQDSGSPQKTAREVMKAFRRESRRGSSRL